LAADVREAKQRDENQSHELARFYGLIHVWFLSHLAWKKQSIGGNRLVIAMSSVDYF
jgi:hypothetical protein